MRKALRQRLKAVLHKGNLTVADLARWFGRPDPTVRGWVKGGAIGGAPLDIEETFDLLKKLEALIGRGKPLPLPRMAARRRIKILVKLRHSRS